MKLKMQGIVKKLESVFDRHDFVRVAYLFGSAAQGKAGPLSDVDVGVFMDKRLDKKKMNRKKLMLVNEISDALNTDNFDLVVMNDAPLLLNYNIIKNGRVLKPGKERVQLETSLMSRYLDRKFYDDMYIRLSLDRISKEGLL